MHEDSGLSDNEQLDDHTVAARANPSLYDGMVTMLDGTDATVQRAAEFVKCGLIRARFGRWALTDFGIEFLGVYYPIDRTRVHESDWLNHLREKSWFDDADNRDFAAVLALAREQWPVEQ